MTFRASAILDILYPRRCALCDRILKRREPYLCRECSPHLKFRKGSTCKICGRPADEAVCGQCRQHEYAFEECLAPFAYEGEIKDSIMRFKYHDRPEYAGFFSAAIIRYAGERIRQWSPDVIVPVPVHKTRMAERGYNQALLLAKEISKKTGIPLAGDLTARVKKTEAQKELGYAERKRNLSNAFVYTGSGKAPRTVLLVDDIFTTGSTLDSISSVLKSNGTEMVYGICICS